MVEQILQQEFNAIVVELQAKHIELGMKASGKWIESLEVEATEEGATLFGEDYTEYLVNGRQPGKFPPIEAIKRWIYDKGLTYDIPINSLAFLIARKISREGTDYYKQGGTDLIESVITPERVQGIIDRVGEELTLRLIELIERKLVEAA